jgi:hypothetical protein
MDALIDVIRSAVASDATSEQKAAGVQACRTIAGALDTEPGKSFVLPGAPQPHPISRLSMDQVLELMIAKLGSVAKVREEAETTAAVTSTPAISPAALRVPMVTSDALKLSARRQRIPTSPARQGRAPAVSGPRTGQRRG